MLRRKPRAAVSSRPAAPTHAFVPPGPRRRIAHVSSKHAATAPALRGPVLGPLCIRHLPLLSPGTDTACFGVGVGQQLLDPATPGKKKSRAKLLPQKEGRTACWDRSCRLDPHTHLLALFDHSSWTVYFSTVLVFQAQMSPISPF